MMSVIKIGDYVKVKEGVQAPDFDYQSMDGWQGEVVGINAEHNIVEITWDIKTLLDTPYDYLHDLISSGYDHESMTLLLDEVEITSKRTASKEEELKLGAMISWIDFYDSREKNEKYGQIFKGISVFDYHGLYQKWEEYLSDNLKFPFEVEVAESERGGLRVGTKIKLLDIDDYDELYGIFGIGKSEKGAVTFPICNLEATDKTSDNYELLRDYVIWFANR